MKAQDLLRESRKNIISPEKMLDSEIQAALADAVCSAAWQALIDWANWRVVTVKLTACTTDNPYGQGLQDGLINERVQLCKDLYTLRKRLMQSEGSE